MEKFFLCMAFLYIFANNDIIKIDDKFIKGKFYMKECDNINTNKKILLNKMLDPSKFTTSYKICKKMTDAYINKYIQELNEEKDDIDVLYKINKNGDMIEFCESWIKYIMENKNSILYLIKHKLISYLETKNPNDNKIEFKLGRKLATDKNLSF